MGSRRARIVVESTTKISFSIVASLGVTAMTAIVVGCGDAPSSDAFVLVTDAATNDDASSGDARVDGAIDASLDVVDTALPPVDTTPPPFDVVGGCPGGSTREGDCPSVCTGGCTGDLCRILCNTINACSATTIACPPERKCVVQCVGLDACSGSTVKCADSAPCAVQCGGTSSCRTLTVDCPPSAGCDLSCGATSACGNAILHCSDGSCLAECSGFPVGPVHVSCGASCACTNKCG